MIIVPKRRNKMCGAEDIREREKWCGDDDMKITNKVSPLSSMPNSSVWSEFLCKFIMFKMPEIQYHGVAALPCNIMLCLCTAVLGHLHSRML